jgi:hypothetical protein
MTRLRLPLVMALAVGATLIVAPNASAMPLGLVKAASDTAAASHAAAHARKARCAHNGASTNKAGHLNCRRPKGAATATGDSSPVTAPTTGDSDPTDTPPTTSSGSGSDQGGQATTSGSDQGDQNDQGDGHDRGDQSSGSDHGDQDDQGDQNHDADQGSSSGDGNQQ